MTITLTKTHLIISGVLLLVGLVVGRLSKRSQGDGFFSRVFSSNRDLDTTLGILLLGIITITMIFHFHDSIKEQAGVIVMGTVNAFTAYALGHKNGKAEANNDGIDWSK